MIKCLNLSWQKEDREEKDKLQDKEDTVSDKESCDMRLLSHGNPPLPPEASQQ